MKITEITESINFYDRFGHDTGAQALPYTVEVRDRETGGKKLISIQAVSAADARERARDRGYRVVRVVSQDDSPGRKNMREHDGRDDEPEETDDDGMTMADRARRDGRGGDDEPETAAQRRKRSLQATRDFNRGRRADGMREGVAEGHADQQRTIVKRNGQPVGEVGIDRESSPGAGQYYMKHYASGTDLSGYGSREEALDDLRHAIKQGVREGKKS